jgi:hypothetical protein
MIEGITKRKPKNDVSHFAVVLEVIFQKWFPLERLESLERKKHAKKLQEDKRKIISLREKFIKNKRPLNLTHIYPKSKNNKKLGQLGEQF